jgi:hypothetical protein
MRSREFQGVAYVVAFRAAGLQVQQAPSLDAISDFNALNNEGPSSNQLLRPEGVEKRPPSNIELLRSPSISFSTQSNPLVQDFFDLDLFSHARWGLPNHVLHSTYDNSNLHRINMLARLLPWSSSLEKCIRLSLRPPPRRPSPARK